MNREETRIKKMRRGEERRREEERREEKRGKGGSGVRSMR